MQNSDDLKATRRKFGDQGVVNYDMQKFSTNGRALFRVNRNMVDIEVEAIELKTGVRGAVVGDYRVYLPDQQRSFTFPSELFRAFFQPIVKEEEEKEEEAPVLSELTIRKGGKSGT